MNNIWNLANCIDIFVKDYTALSPYDEEDYRGLLDQAEWTEAEKEDFESFINLQAKKSPYTRNEYRELFQKEIERRQKIKTSAASRLQKITQFMFEDQQRYLKRKKAPDVEIRRFRLKESWGPRIYSSWISNGLPKLFYKILERRQYPPVRSTREDDYPAYFAFLRELLQEETRNDLYSIISSEDNDTEVPDLLEVLENDLDFGFSIWQSISITIKFRSNLSKDKSYYAE